MADILIPIGTPDPVTGARITERYKDMGDGTFARVVSDAGGGGSVTLPDLAALGVSVVAEVNITTEQLEIGDPILAMAAPGVGFVVEVVHASCAAIPGATPNDTGVTGKVVYEGQTDNVFSGNTLQLASSTASWSFASCVSISSIDLVNVENKGVYVLPLTTIDEGKTDTSTVWVTYAIRQLP